MQIDLPEEVIQRANRLAVGDEDAGAVISKALARLEWEAAEVAAVREGVDAYKAGDHRPLADFGRDLSERYGVALPEE